uniref:Uncharacterized protein n=1 Tax=Anguilla anguilla TaxID=7936 RepID=A0A0E9U2V2_ANGAN
MVTCRHFPFGQTCKMFILFK